MARSLPLQHPAVAIDEMLPSLSGTVAIYDPAMCCATGACGPAIDPALLEITRDLRWLEKQGVVVQRYGLSQEPGEFVKQPKITGLMQAFGDDALPATLVNGEVATYGRYPSRDELSALLGRNINQSSAAPEVAEAGCCPPGTSC